MRRQAKNRYNGRNRVVRIPSLDQKRESIASLLHASHLRVHLVFSLDLLKIVHVARDFVISTSRLARARSIYDIGLPAILRVALARVI